MLAMERVAKAGSGIRWWGDGHGEEKILLLP